MTQRRPRSHHGASAGRLRRLHYHVATQALFIRRRLRPAASFYLRRQWNSFDFGLMNGLAGTYLAPVVKDRALAWVDPAHDLLAIPASARKNENHWLFLGPTHRPRSARGRGVDADLGMMLGYPGCCVQAYIRDRRRGGIVAPVHRLLRQARPNGFGSFGITAGKRGYGHGLVPWVPCGPGCPATLKWLRRAAKILVEEKEPILEEFWREESR